jgi:hypothetical protein
MSSNNIPPHVIAALDQRHAQADAALTDLMNRLTAQGIAGLDAPEQAVGATVLLGRLPHTTVITIAAAAITRLLKDRQSECARCDGTGTVHVRLYGGHTVPCGLCRGTGHTELENT